MSWTLIGFASKDKCQQKLTWSVDFINILQAAFMCADPKSAKRQSTQAAFLRFQELCA